MLELDSLSKTYRVGTLGSKKLEAVRDVTFGVRRGEVVSLIGESGSGKSTIGKMVLRLTPITTGTIRFQGVDVGSMGKAALRDYYQTVQGVFQDPFSSYNPIFKADRVFSSIRGEFFPSIEDTEWEGRVEETVASVGLNPAACLGRFPHQLSGGQLQRLLIARALLLDIDFLVADEIISMLDASTRIDVLNLLAELKERGLSILFITHDLSLGYYISEQSVILRRGRVVEMGDTVKVFDHPEHPYTKHLMESVAHLDSKWDERTKSKSQWRLEERCDGAPDRHPPRLVELEENHQVTCHLVSEMEDQ